MRITLNLATRPFADLGPAIKRLRITMAVLAVVSIGLGFGLHALHNKAEAARAREHSLDGQIAHITEERESFTAMMRQPPNAKLLNQSIALNHMFDDKSFSWTLAMEELETVLPGQVMVQNLEPIRAKDGHITIHLRVAGPRNMSVDLVRNLERSRHFLLPRIVGETAEETEGPNKQLTPVSETNRVDFDLLADYNPIVPMDRKATKKQDNADEAGTAEAGPAASPSSQHAHKVFAGPAASKQTPNKRQKAPAPKISAPKPNPSTLKAPGGLQ